MQGGLVISSMSLSKIRKKIHLPNKSPFILKNISTRPHHALLLPYVPPFTKMNPPYNAVILLAQARNDTF